MEAVYFHDFESAGKAVLQFLHRRLGFKLWMVTRTHKDDWIVLQSEDHGYEVNPGTVFKWSESFCSEMVQGRGPRIAPDSQAIYAYRNAGIGQQVPIKAYIGVPLVCADGSLFGTLCAIDPDVQPVEIEKERDLVDLLGALLSTQLQRELDQADNQRSVERSVATTVKDSETQFFNPKSWVQILEAEDARCRRYGHSAVVVGLSVQINTNKVNPDIGADSFISKVGFAIKQAVRTVDAVARFGKSDFAVLGVECDAEGAEALVQRLSDELSDVGVVASICYELRQHGGSLMSALEEVKNRMKIASIQTSSN